LTVLTLNQTFLPPFCPTIERLINGKRRNWLAATARWVKRWLPRDCYHFSYAVKQASMKKRLTRATNAKHASGQGALLVHDGCETWECKCRDGHNGEEFGKHYW
jgi:hypothetical protein